MQDVIDNVECIEELLHSALKTVERLDEVHKRYQILSIQCKGSLKSKHCELGYLRHEIKRGFY